MANRPQILLLDEPTAALDEETKGEVEALLRRVVAERNLTCLFVIHDMNQVVHMVSHVMRMEQVRMVDLQPAEEVHRAELAPA